MVETVEVVEIVQSARSRLKAAPTGESFSSFLCLLSPALYLLSPVFWALNSGY
jgi:hypothetical protein